jgi:type IV secretion system protein VirB10
VSDLAERGVSPVAGGGSRFLRTKRSRQLAYGAVGVVALAMMVISINGMLNLTPASHPESTGSNMIAQAVATPTAAPQSPPPAAAQQAPAVVAANVVPEPKEYVRFPASGGGEYFEPARQEEKKVDKPEEEKKPTGTEVAFKPTEIPGGKAGKAIRLTYVMLPTMIPCILDTAMDSTLAGAIRCHTTEDILSPEHVLLMPAGTQIMGKYKNDAGAQGGNRLFAFTGSAITKDGIPVPLDSEVADGVGRAGIDGQVDHHYMERFGAALVLSVADAGLQLGQAELSKSGQTNLNIGGGGGGGLAGLAQTILNKTINMPDTIYVQPSKQITIVTDHPISFEDALHVTTRE